LLALVDARFLATVCIGQIDVAADSRHPGPASHDAMAHAMLAFLDRIEREPEVPRRAARAQAPDIFVFGADDGDGRDLDRSDGWPARFAARWAAGPAQEPGSARCSVFALPGASNQQIARLVLTECERQRPDLMLVHFAPHDRAEGFAEGQPFPIGPWLLTREQRRAARRAPRADGCRRRMLEQVRRARDYYEFATEGLGAMETLRNILLVQYYCAARGIRAIALCRSSPRLLSDEALRIESLSHLIAQVDGGFVADFGDPELRSQDGRSDGDALAGRMLELLERAAAS
jgi:hypothetical protein